MSNIIIDILRYFDLEMDRINEVDLISKVKSDFKLSEKEAKTAIVKMIQGGYIKREGEPQGQMISIESHGINLLMEYSFKLNQLEILNRQTQILSKMNLIYWILAIATIVMAITTFMLYVKK